MRAQRRGGQDLEQALLRALLLAPEALAAVRDRVELTDFQDGECGALAAWLWSGRADLPETGAEAALARELASGGSAGQDWVAEAVGAARRMVERRLLQRLKERKLELGRTPDGPETTRLMTEVDELARSLKELNAQR